ncbi:MAG: hypothetical protein D3923_08860 [Candidatus Electrothrix sp. AR3]|nr:hypothetical protein [Candidatus Electrothrix sp. AR3]
MINLKAKIFFLSLLLVLITTLPLLTSCDSSVKNEKKQSVQLDKVSLRLPIPIADTGFSPYYLAVDKGIFNKYGLEVRLEPGSPELNPVKMVSQGQDQFGVVGGPELLMTGRAKGAGIIGIAQIHKDSDFSVLLTLKESGITTLPQLEGKKVGFFIGHISTDIIHMLLTKEGITVDELDVGFDYGQLLTGKIDAQWAFRSTAGVTLPAKGIALNIISPADYGISTQGHMVIANEALVNDKPDLVQRFTNAVLEGLQYSVDYPNEAVLATMQRDPQFKAEIGEEQMKINIAAVKNNNRLGWIDQKDMEKTKAQLLSVNLLSEDFVVANAFTTAFLEQALKAE